LDHLPIFGERQLGRVLKVNAGYFNQHRPHQGLAQRIPQPLDHSPAAIGQVISISIFGRAASYLYSSGVMPVTGHLYTRMTRVASTGQLKAKRRGQAGPSWYTDETYIKIKGRWHYLYLAIDREGNLVDTMLSETRDLAAAKAFFKQALATVGHKPERVTTDGHDSYPQAIRNTLGRKVEHRTNRYLNNRIEQDHRAVKQHYYPMRGSGSLAGAARFCTAFDEVRHYFRPTPPHASPSALAHIRQAFCQRWAALCAAWQVA
jgi:transposase-like protein